MAYNFGSPIEIGKDSTVVLGIGFPTIISGTTTGKQYFVIADDVTGVPLAGFLLQAIVILNTAQHHHFKRDQMQYLKNMNNIPVVLILKQTLKINM